MLDRFLGDERGATAIEYAIMALFVFMAIVLAVSTIGPKLAPIFMKVAQHI